MTTALQTAPGGYGHPAGIPALRRAIAHWVGRSRAVEATADQVIITAGAQQCIDLVTRVLVRPGAVVAVEDPGEACMVYTTPSHQSPTGVTMSMARRRELLRFAEDHDVAIIEDDYDSEYRHSDRPLEPLHRLDAHGRVIYVGTFSKTLSPSLRLGFIVLPQSLVSHAIALRSLIDWQPPVTLQATLLRFIVDGRLDRYLRRTRTTTASAIRSSPTSFAKPSTPASSSPPTPATPDCTSPRSSPAAPPKQRSEKPLWPKASLSVIMHSVGSDRTPQPGSSSGSEPSPQPSCPSPSQRSNTYSRHDGRHRQSYDTYPRRFVAEVSSA